MNMDPGWKTGPSFASPSPAATERWGEELGRRIERGLCLCLRGPLGAGKTLLVRSLCRGLEVEEEVLSPTFVLYEEFQGRLPVVHLDLFRMEYEREIEELGVLDRLDGSWVVMVEWGERSELLGRFYDAEISIEVAGPESRILRVRYRPGWEELFQGAS